MSKYPHKRIEMSTDMFKIYLTVALVLGMHIPGVYEFAVARWG